MAVQGRERVQLPTSSLRLSYLGVTGGRPVLLRQCTLTIERGHEDDMPRAGQSTRPL